MAISVRLPRAKQASLARLAKTKGLSKSDLIREAIDRLLETGPPADGLVTAYDLLASNIGCGHSSESETLSEKTGRRFTRLIREKARVRRHAH
jgi:predicted DNA-binding protein